MKHYLYILLMTWACMGSVLLLSWLLLLFGLDLGDFTILVPIIVTLVAVARIAKTPWFNDNIRQPLAETLDYGNIVEVILHLQFFTIICGVLGLGLGVAAVTSIYPIGLEAVLAGVAGGEEQLYNFGKYDLAP